MPQIRKVRGFLLKVASAQTFEPEFWHGCVFARAKNDQRVIRPRIRDGRSMTKQQLRLEELAEQGRQMAKHPELKPKPRPEGRGMAFAMAHPNGPLKRVNCKSRLVKLQVHKSPKRFSMVLLIRVTMRRAFGWMQMRQVHLGKCQPTLLKALLSRIVNLEEVNRPLSLQRLVRCLRHRANLCRLDGLVRFLTD